MPRPLRTAPPWPARSARRTPAPSSCRAPRARARTRARCRRRRRRRPCALLPAAPPARASRAATGRDAPMMRSCGKWTCVSTKPGSRKPPRQSTTAASGSARAHVVEVAARDDAAVANEQPAVFVARERAGRRETDWRRVKERRPQELARRSSERRDARRARARTAKNTRSGVAGLSKVTTVAPSPNAATASRSASRTEIASISGGSPTALLPHDDAGLRRALEKVDVEDLGHLRPRRQLVGGRAGRSRAVPASSQSSSSSVSQPTPWMKPPSIWPRSTIGEIESPTSCRMSVRSRRYSPVKPSTSTSDTAAPYAK